MDVEKWLAARKPNINSTDSATLFGLSKYQTLFTLWHVKKGNIDDFFRPNERVIIGQHVEDGIASAFTELTGWSAEPFKDYLTIEGDRIGSSFDYIITSGPYLEWLLEIKNVDFLVFRDEWSYNNEFDAEAPIHIEIQVQHQLMVSGKDGAIILACVGGNSLKWIIRERDDDMIHGIKSKIIEFWRSIDENIEPQPNYERDAQALALLYGSADPEKVYQCDDEESEEIDALLSQYTEWKNQIKKLESLLLSIKSMLWERFGDAGKAFTKTHKISMNRTKDGKPTILEVTEKHLGEKLTLKKGRSGYRQFRFSRYESPNDDDTVD